MISFKLSLFYVNTLIISSLFSVFLLTENYIYFNNYSNNFLLLSYFNHQLYARLIVNKSINKLFNLVLY